MTIVLLDAPTPFTPWGTTQFYLIPVIASASLIPTRTEIDASTDLTPQVTEAVGWAETGNTVDSQAFSGPSLKLGGPPTFQDSSFTFRRSKTGTDIRDLLAFGDSALIGVFWDGDDDTRTFDVFKTSVIGNPKSLSITDPATVQYQFSILKAALDTDVPA